MKKLLLTISCLAFVDCTYMSSHEYTLKNNDSNIEKIIISGEYRLPEKRLTNLLDTMRLVSENKTIDNQLMSRVGMIMRFEGELVMEYDVAFVYCSVQTNPDFSITEIDPTKSEYYTDLVEVREGIWDSPERAYTLNIRQDKDKFYFMQMEQNPDTEVYEYKYHAMVNTTNITYDGTDDGFRLGILADIETPDILK